MSRTAAGSSSRLGEPRPSSKAESLKPTDSLINSFQITKNSRQKSAKE